MTASRRLIVNADDFGRSRAINEAAIRAHQEGILTSASLMVNESASEDAVALAKKNPNLGIGLHLVLACGRSALPQKKVHRLVNERESFSSSPVRAGLRYFFSGGMREQLRAEIHAQFEKFRATGLELDHVNGHLHFHLHPAVFGILMEDAATLGIRHLRLTRDSLRLNARLAGGRWAYRVLHAMIFSMLSARAENKLAARKIKFANRVFGLLQDSHVDEEFILKLLENLPDGDSELYSHPSLDRFRHEFEALVSPRVKAAITDHGIRLIRYRDL